MLDVVNDDAVYDVSRNNAILIRGKKMIQIIWGILFIIWAFIGTFQITCSIISKDYTVSLWNYISCWVMLMIMISAILTAIIQS